MAKVTLDRETFKALASETRLDVLRSLDERRKTGSELARALELNKATVHEHLQLLATVGLVKKVDEGRKWIYYELTWQGQRLLHPEVGTTFSVLLGLSVAAAGGGIAMLGRALGWWLDSRTAQDDSADGPSTLGAPEGDTDNQSAQQEMADAGEGPAQDMGGSTFFDDGGWLAIAFLVTAVVVLALAWVLRRRR